MYMNMKVLNYICGALGRKKSNAQCGIHVVFTGENGDLCTVCRDFFERRVGRHLEEAGKQVCCVGLVPRTSSQLL